MEQHTILQPLDGQTGEWVRELLRADYKHIACAVAYARASAVARLSEHLQQTGAKVQAFCSKDSRITSVQAVELLMRHGVETYLVGSQRQKYHPKFWLAWSDDEPRFELILGSGNLTVGGLWINIEAALRLRGDQRQEKEKAVLDTLKGYITELRQHAGKPVRTEEFHKLVRDGLLADESQQPEAKAPPRRTAGKKAAGREFLGQLKVPPVSKQAIKLASTSPSPPGRKRRKGRLTVSPGGIILMLNKLKGPSIPGEIRIPIAAVRSAEEFWDWPDKYVKDTSHKGTFYNRTPMPAWSVLGGQGKPVRQRARLYLYQQSMDFRLYSTAIRERVDEGEGDIVVISRSEEPGVDYQVEIVLRTDAHYQDALSLCTEAVPNSRRRWGFLAKDG